MTLIIALVVVNVALALAVLYYGRTTYRERKELEAREAMRAYMDEHGAWSDEQMNKDWWNEPPGPGEA